MPKKVVSIPALKVQQWLPQWNKVHFDASSTRRKPDPYFFVFSLKATWLRKLSGVYRRKAVGKRSEDLASQRIHRQERSKEISQFIQGGFPWSNLTKKQRQLPDYKDLKMPGWLSTAIIANVHAPGAVRNNIQISERDLVKIKEGANGISQIDLPSGFESNSWKPSIPPIEIIDGQHRLLALDEDDLAEKLGDTYELPVVAFFNLDITWQAYLFYTINIKPKRINASLAYDIYPLLRTQDWLEASPARAHIYRETRAQEITEALWSFKGGPWFRRINMLGEPSGGTVTQAAFIRALVSTFVRRWDVSRVGGLFGAALSEDSSDVLAWGRLQQAAFIAFLWQTIRLKIDKKKPTWGNALAEEELPLLIQDVAKPKISDFAFTSRYSLLASDQGVRGILHAFNDILYVGSHELGLKDWSDFSSLDEDPDLSFALGDVIETIPTKIAQFVALVAEELVTFEWRNSSAPSLTKAQSEKQMIYRGSGGYKQLRIGLTDLLKKSKDQRIKRLANEVAIRLNY